MKKNLLKRLGEALGMGDEKKESTASGDSAEGTAPNEKPRDASSSEDGSPAKPRAAEPEAETLSPTGQALEEMPPPASEEVSSAVPTGDSPGPPLVCLFFEVHQPNRLRKYDFFDIGQSPFYEDDELNERLLNEACELSYLPANRLFKKLIEESDGRFRISMSLSGVLIEQLEVYRPDVLKSFQELHATGAVEIVGETYYHSMGFHRSKKEFAEQVEKQTAKIQEVFGVTPRSFRHTACVYFNELASFVESLGFESMMADAVGTILQGREANRLYRSPNVKAMKTILRNGGMSDDLAVRFGITDWDEYPLTAEKYARWCYASDGEVVTVAMDYDCIGRHQTKEDGIFDFWEAFPAEFKKLGGQFATVPEVTDRLDVHGEYDCPEPTSWAGAARDLSAWKENTMQQEARKKILIIEDAVKAENDPELLHQWRKMQTAEHFLYMSTKTGPEGRLHDRLRPYPSAYDAYLSFMNALSDLQLRLDKE
jgi:alpha-amylase